MLILTRKVGESIRIGDDIVIKVVSMDNKHVKIGIDAPREVSVNREEIYQKIQEENMKAAQTQDNLSFKDIAALLKSDNENGPKNSPFSSIFENKDKKK